MVIPDSKPLFYVVLVFVDILLIAVGGSWWDEREHVHLLSFSSEGWTGVRLDRFEFKNR